MDHLFAAGVSPRNFKREGLQRRAEVVEAASVRTESGDEGNGGGRGERKGSDHAVEQAVP